MLQTGLLAVNVVRSTGFWLYLKGKLTGFTNGLKVECGREKSVIIPSFWLEQIEGQSCHQPIYEKLLRDRYLSIIEVWRRDRDFTKFSFACIKF